jgi:hypothetical protein
MGSSFFSRFYYNVFTSADALDSVDKFIIADAFQHVARRTCLDRREQQFILSIRGEHNDFAAFDSLDNLAVGFRSPARPTE